MGIAILRKEKLSIWEIKTFKGHWNEGKLKDILFRVNEIIDRYEVTHICLKRSSKNQTSEGLSKLISEITFLSKRKKLVINQYDLQDLKSLFTDNYKFTKQSMFRALAEQNPFLHEQYNRELKLSVPYYEKMFEAIISVLLYRKMHPPQGLIVSPFSPLYY
ncbi:MAG: hypothetical protein DWQ44_09820 [Bacteroidetes bacterium]|nr:MAG: hypothetical protein DWQ33_10095 [Bacteroidota bacterium]REK06579.1 MAG: hypothetical protein DWQ39_03610 [Bacteroidota bacterium]REK33345.1 MAG: hypothetical protein DWQ44_09820 [Bacteroidota bacterium]REK49745.1 MAG: hypothetical protein DWQ48_06375 [Bacteroidota bacterium]